MNLGPLQATVAPLRQEVRSQQLSVEAEVEAQVAPAVPQLVEDPVGAGPALRGRPALHTARVVRQEVGQEVASGVHSSGVNHIIQRQIQPRSLGWKARWEDEMVFTKAWERKKTAAELQPTTSPVQADVWAPPVAAGIKPSPVLFMLVSLTQTWFAHEVYRFKKKKEGTRNRRTLTLIPQQGSVLTQPVLGRGELAGKCGGGNSKQVVQSQLQLVDWFRTGRAAASRAALQLEPPRPTEHLLKKSTVLSEPG